MTAHILLVALVLTAAPAVAEDIVRFVPLAGDVPNPERGFWRFAGRTFQDDDPQGLRSIRAAGMTLAYGPVRLDAYRDRRLDQALLDDLDHSFANARAAGVKVILRFAYNYPETEAEFAVAKDAPLPVVLGHIGQLAPLLDRNADTIAVVQAGFIGAWGEGHTSPNGLDEVEAKAAIRDALLAVVPPGVPIQWRYPPDLIAWEADGHLGRMGFHNDCFLSSPTDVGTYAEDADGREVERAWAMTLTGRTFFSGETCDAQPDLVRTGCDAILAEVAAFHLSALGRDYWLPFHEAWAREGCLGEVSARMGYRLRLVEARVGDGHVEVDVANDGWAMIVRPRPLLVVADGRTVNMCPATLDAVAPGTTVTFSGALDSAAKRLCVAAPDPSPRLAADARFSVRFANADLAGQAWDDGMFCFDAAASP